MSKVCFECGESKPLEAYTSRGNGHRRRECNECRSAKRRATHNPERVRAIMLRYKYGISVEEYDQMFKNQDGVCAICHKPDKVLCVDHDHNTGEIRGLLCAQCNTALGKFRDDPLLLQRAAEYVMVGGANVSLPIV